MESLRLPNEANEDGRTRGSERETSGHQIAEEYDARTSCQEDAICTKVWEALPVICSRSMGIIFLGVYECI